MRVRQLLSSQNKTSKSKPINKGTGLKRLINKMRVQKITQ